MNFLRISIVLALFLSIGQSAVYAQESADSPVETTQAPLNSYRDDAAQQITLDPIITRHAFDGVVFHWQIDGDPNDIRLAYRTQSNDVWSAWESLVANEEYRAYDTPDNEYASTMYSFPVAVQAWQISVLHARNSTARLSEIRATTMSSLSESPRIDPATMAQPNATGARPNIVPRATWGGSTVQAWDTRGNACAGDPNSCPADATWMPTSSEIAAPTHIVIHHTAGPNHAPAKTNWSSIVRNIWSYHAIINNWGDIGYHFLIDPNGVIYEGRYTGVRDNGTVINGAHAYGFNYGSIGISMIGTFSSQQPTAAAQASLNNMLSWLTIKYNISPGVERPYRPHTSSANYTKYVNYNNGAGVNLNTIEGHRVTGAIISQIVNQGWGTTCPGDALYALLPNIRRSITPTDWIPNVSVSKRTVYTDEPVTFNVTIRNAYTSGNISGSAFTFNDTGYTYTQDQCWAWKDGSGAFAFDKPSTSTSPNNRFRMIAGYANWDRSYANTANQCATASTANHPWRWSIGAGALAPGQTRTVVGTVSFQEPGTYKVFFGLIKDWVGYPDGGCIMGDPYGACGLRTITIRVIIPPTPTPTTAPAAETVLALASATAQSEQAAVSATQVAAQSTLQADMAQATQEAQAGSPTRTPTPSVTRTATATPITLQQTVAAMRTETRVALADVASTKRAARMVTFTAVSQLRDDKRTAVAETRTSQAQNRLNTLATRAALQTMVIEQRQTLIADRQTATAEVALSMPSRTPSLSPTATASRTPVPSRTRMPSATPTSSRTATASATLTPTVQSLVNTANATNAVLTDDARKLVAISAGVIVLDSNLSLSNDLASLIVLDATTLATITQVPVSGITAYQMALAVDDPQTLLVAGKLSWNLAFLQRFDLSSGTPVPTGIWVTQTTGQPTALIASSTYTYLTFADNDQSTYELRTLYALANGYVESAPAVKLPGQINTMMMVDDSPTQLLIGGSYGGGRGYVSPVENKGRVRLRGRIRLSAPVNGLYAIPAIQKLRPVLSIAIATDTEIAQATFDTTSNRLRVMDKTNTFGGVHSWQPLTNARILTLRSTDQPQVSVGVLLENGFQWLANTSIAPLSSNPRAVITVSADALYWIDATHIYRVPYTLP